MKNIRNILFFIMIGMYAAGLCIGSIQLIRTENQDELYRYLESAVAEYNVTSIESIKSVAKDNVKLLTVVLVSGIFRIVPVTVAALILIKGYTAGFAITSMLRFYGVGGLFFCGASIISAMLVIPSLALYGSMSLENTLYNRRNKRLFVKSYLILAVFMLVVFCIDTVGRGFFSALFMKLASAFTKPA